MFTSSWNWVYTFVKGLCRLNSVGVDPLLLSAITLAAHASASSRASFTLMPSEMFWLYLLRTSVSAVKLSIHSIGLDALSERFCAHVFTSGSLPLRLVRKVDISTMPSSTL